MDPITKYLNNIAYKFPKGYPDMNDPKDKAMLFEIAYKLIEQEEEAEKEDLIDTLISVIKSSNLSDDELNAYIKSVTNRGLKGDITNKLSTKGYTGDSFKVGNKAIDYIIDKIADSEAEEFTKYQPKRLNDAPIGGESANFSKVTGMSPQLVQDLFDIEPGADAGGSSIGKGELFLALAFKDIDNRGGGGDLNFNKKNLEVKGSLGRLGQQGGRASDPPPKYYLELLGERYLEGKELEEFINDPKNTDINFALKELFEKAKANDANTNDVINSITKVLDTMYFNKGLAKTYFGSANDYKDLATMKKSLLKLNAAAYAKKTKVGYFIFINSRTGDYALIDISDLDDSIDADIIDTATKSPTKGYRWNNPHPSLVIK